MPSDPFVHLHVASGYSLRYGASHPHLLVQRAADHGMDTLALTDRDGVYGAVKFARAAAEAGLSRAVTPREADDLLRDVQTFLALVETTLGLDHQPVLPQLAHRAS